MDNERKYSILNGNGEVGRGLVLDEGGHSYHCNSGCPVGYLGERLGSQGVSMSLDPFSHFPS